MITIDPGTLIFPGALPSPITGPLYGNVVGTRYGYQVQPWNAPLSFGVQALIEYNGYVINDRYQSDRIRVFNITGLDDADSSDSREVVPGDHGETVYDSWYRGRTFVISGQIQAGSLGTLKRLERDFKAAYASLNESPMKFRWFDVYDSFDDPLTLNNYTPVIGLNSYPLLYVSGGVLQFPFIANMLLMRSADNRLWADAQTTIRIIVGSTTDLTKVSLVPSYVDTHSFIAVTYLGSQQLRIDIYREDDSQSTPIQIPVTGIAQGQSVWLRARREGNLITAELWTVPPTDTAFPAFSGTTWLTGRDADTFGDQVLSQVGFGLFPDQFNGTTQSPWALDDFKVETLSPCDVMFPAKKMPNGMSIKDSQDSITRFARAFQLTMRTSRPFASAATQSRSLPLVPTSIAGLSPVFGFSAPLTSPIEALVALSDENPAQQSNILYVRNRGTAFDRPVIYFYGSSTGFSIINLVNGMQINWSGTLFDGDYLVFDCTRRTLVNSTGSNMMKYFSANSPYWMVLEAGWNDVYVGGVGYSANTQMVIFTRGQWL